MSVPAVNGLTHGPGSPLLSAKDEEVNLEQIRRYEDFSTVDWIQDSLHERNIRLKKVHGDYSHPGAGTGGDFASRMHNVSGIIGMVYRFFARMLEEGQTWVVFGLVGIGIGLNAALISIITVWLSDLKMGYCTTGWWLSQKFCCAEVSEEGEACAEWRNWGGIEPFRYMAYIFFAALFSFSAAKLVKSFAPYAAGSGISEIKCIIGGFIINGYLSFWTLAIKSLTLPLAIGSGLSVGKEGPSVHVACCVGNVIGQMFRKYRGSQIKMRELLTAASAAGVAVAFGSPIGGVLFAIEEMSHNFTNKTMWRSFVCALVATFTLSAMNPFRTGKLVLFQVSYDRDWHYFEIPAYVLIGIFGGLYGAFVIKFNLQVAAFRRKHLAAHGIYEAVTLAVLSAMIGYFNRFLRIDMTESLEYLFKECEGGGNYNGLCQTSTQWRMVNSLLLATIIRTGLVILSYGCKVPAGIFVPSMAVGAVFGRMMGILAKATQAAHPTSAWFAVCVPDQPCITPGTYAFLGAAAALGGVTRITVTVVVIMFELTGALTYILPLMITLLVTKAVSDFFGGGGMSDQMILFNGYPFLEKEDKEDDDHAYFEPIVNVMKRDLIVVYADGMPVPQLEEILQSTDYRGFPVVKSQTDPTVLGFIRKTELRYSLDRIRRRREDASSLSCTFQDLDGDEQLNRGDRSQTVFDNSPYIGGPPMPASNSSDQIDLGQYVDQTLLSVSPQLPLEIVMQMFRRMGPRVILVAKEGKLLGLVTVKDVLKHEAAVEHLHRQQQVSVAANTSSFQDWRDTVFNMEENAAGLEVVLEEVLKVVKGVGERVNSLLGHILGRFGGVSGFTGGNRQSSPRGYAYAETRGRDSNEPRGEEFELGGDEDD
ncbi:hypothetical protein NliqN6_5564 [Naganishia liquefaciens]|uniref:Chloride channel protein n=1 Tax=Naganishia liquefaciens TaxID=104408 RepID=A0A8H3TXZ8_9TREE|nr:hypothetical protein NliqN6_5564 [Naganishia liquefaciens]